MIARMNDLLIFDIGMSTGQDTAYYLHRGFKVVAVEANPLLAAQVAARYPAEIDSGRLIIENVAISETSGSADFWICDDKPDWSSFDRACASRRGYRHHAIQVQCATLPGLIRKHGQPHYIKIDIEGHDRICITQLSPADAPPFLSVETYGCNAESVADLLALGYTKFKISDQVCFRPVEDPPLLSHTFFWALQRFYYQSEMDRHAYAARFFGKLGGRALANRIVRRYRSSHGHAFADGAAGPFGDDLPGRWLPGPETARLLKDLVGINKKLSQGRFSRWFDLHACK